MQIILGWKPIQLIRSLTLVTLISPVLTGNAFAQTATSTDRLPNIVLIMADDLGYGELGYYGQQASRTPRLDELASQGMAFTQFYAGATVCAPSRCTLMTGRHNGHATVRGNATQENSIAQSLRHEDYTVAELLKSRGYDTACVGKWGLGELSHPGHPMEQGFDHFYGYLNQVHAHNYYPGFLYNDREPQFLRNKVVIADPERGDVGGGYATEKLDYSANLFADKSLEFLTLPRSNPFFLYLALTLPHANNEANRLIGNGAEVPDWSEYANQPWSLATKQHAAMVTHMDSCVGRIIDQLRRLSLDENTLVIFTSDNGPHGESNDRDMVLLNPSGPFRGIKRSMYEGGIHVPMICWWPGHILPGTVSPHIGFSGDLFATLADLTGGPAPKADGPIDSISIAATLLPERFRQQQEHEYLYFEFHEQGTRQAVRFGNWKAIRQPMFTGNVELYDLENDPSETQNVASKHADKVKQATEYMDQAHVPNDNWPVASLKAP